MKTNFSLLVIWSATSNYLSISFAGKKNCSPEDADHIKSIAGNVLELDLSGCTISLEMIRVLAELTELRKLSLQKSSISDGDFQGIVRLKNLSVLNLGGTSFSDEGIISLEGLTSLRKIFLYQSRVTNRGVQELRQLLPAAQIDTGNYRLPFLATDTVHHKRSK